MFGKPKPKILIVEDNKSNHLLFTEAFSAAGFSVTICPYVDAQFVEDVASIQPDIISMDIMIAGPAGSGDYDGFSALALLKGDERTKHIPVMFLSNFFEESKINKAKAGGAVDFINLQGYAIKTIPAIFKHYLDNPERYRAIHEEFRKPDTP